MNKILLLIPHYNNTKGLINSISSIDEKENIDIIIVDDGSKKYIIDEVEIKNRFKAKGKIYFKYLSENKGIEVALNIGLDFALSENKYKYIARLDCGDICLGKRFKIQSDFLEKNPEIKLVGSYVRAHCVDGNHLFDLVRPILHEQIKKKMYLNSMFVHPAVMFSVDAVKIIGKYPTNYKSAEDYAYFFQFVKRFRVANIDQFLLQIEINETGISYVRRKEQVLNRIRIIKNNFYFGFYPIYGIFRSIALYIMPYKLIFSLKRIFLK
ncbi:MAG: glycosyltransferase [Flavobacterium johnsoniae]|nr:MAG: glycosyltransferase [Flavobacterium johnsoniae]